MDVYIENHLEWRLLSQDDWEEMFSLRTQLEALDDSVLPAIDRVIGGADQAITQGDAVGGWDSYGSMSAFGWNIHEPGDPSREDLPARRSPSDPPVPGHRTCAPGLAGGAGACLAG